MPEISKPRRTAANYGAAFGVEPDRFPQIVLIPVQEVNLFTETDVIIPEIV